MTETVCHGNTPGLVKILQFHCLQTGLSYTRSLIPVLCRDKTISGSYMKWTSFVRTKSTRYHKPCSLWHTSKSNITLLPLLSWKKSWNLILNLISFLVLYHAMRSRFILFRYGEVTCQFHTYPSGLGLLADRGLAYDKSHRITLFINAKLFPRYGGISTLIISTLWPFKEWITIFLSH